MLESTKPADKHSMWQVAKELQEAGGVWHLDAKRLPPGRYRLACMLSAKPLVRRRVLNRTRSCKVAILEACEAAGAHGEPYDVERLIDDVITRWTADHVRAAYCLRVHCSTVQLCFSSMQVALCWEAGVLVTWEHESFCICQFADSFRHVKHTGFEVSGVHIMCHKVDAAQCASVKRPQGPDLVCVACLTERLHANASVCAEKQEVSRY